MKRTVIAMLLVLVFVSGCGTTPILYSRLDVTPQLQTDCPTLSTSEINALITIIETDRQSGYSKASELNTALNITCQNNFPCFTCVSSIINQVYDGI